MLSRKQILFAAALSCMNPGFAWSQAVDSEPESVSVPIAEPIKPRAPAIPGQTGLASYYHVTFHGQRTASGEMFNQNAMTAAHKTLPFGTLVRVINLRNERSVIVRVNDRGPVHNKRLIDVSQRAARELGFLAQGMTWVKLEVVPTSDLSDLQVK